MITAVDSSVLIDVLFGDGPFAQPSADAVGEAISLGALVACEVVWAEVTGWAPSARAMVQALHELGVTYVPVISETAVMAGATWARYRRAGGSRQRMVPDFLIGAHANVQADRLLTRDRGFYRSYFADLTIVDPTSH